MNLRLNLFGFLAAACLAAQNEASAALFTVVSADESGPGSLREAIENANASPGPDQIYFQIDSGPATIVLLSPLPAIVESVTIDATTQPGYAGTPLIELSGENLTSPDEDHGLIVMGGPTTIRGLVINRFPGAGLVIVEAGSNVIEGNFIGTDATGEEALANVSGGLYITSAGNRIGGDTTAARNLISGNNNSGLILDGPGATGNVIAGNWFGLNATGTRTVPNVIAGIIISEARGNVIGGSSAGHANVLSGNDGHGVFIIYGAQSNHVAGNFIGTDPTGELAGFGNVEGGVTLLDAPGNFIGGSRATEGNVISGNYGIGIFVSSSASSGNRICGNLVGLSAGGTAPLGNGQGGISVLDAGENVIGGSDPEAGNIVSGNDAVGILISGTGASNKVSGNWVGLNLSGSAAIPNRFSGIVVAAPQTTVGGRLPAERNVASGNRLGGIQISGAEGSNATIVGNFVGTDVAGSQAVPNGFQGVVAIDSANATIGGSAPGEGNLISGNTGAGVTLVNSRGMQILGNRIGVASDGSSPLGNGAPGVVIRACLQTKCGGPLPGEGNQIAFNTRAGVLVETGTGPGLAPSQGNRISGNSIHHNAGLSIDLGGDGATPNDPLDVDSGPNQLQNHPVLTEPVAMGSRRIVAGTLSSTPDSDFWIDVYAAADCLGIPAYLGSSPVRTDFQGVASFQLSFSNAPSASVAFSATASDAAGNTSEFSDCVLIPSVLALSIRRIASPVEPSEIELSWNDPEGIGVLEQTLQLSEVSAWTPATAPVVAAGDLHTVRISATERQRFFRVRRPDAAHAMASR